MFTRSTMTLEYSTLSRINPRTFRSKVYDTILQIYVFGGSIWFFKYLVFHYDIFKEPKIDSHAPQ